MIRAKSTLKGVEKLYESMLQMRSEEAFTQL